MQSSLNQIRHATAGVLHFIQDHEVHGHSLLLREGAEGQHLSKMSPAIPFIWLPTVLTMGVYGFEVKYKTVRSRPRKALITIQTI